MELFSFLIAVAIYFLPSIIGYNKKNANSICILNFFLGWTFIGWVVALVWAVSKDKDSEKKIIKDENLSKEIDKVRNEMYELYMKQYVGKNNLERNKIFEIAGNQFFPFSNELRNNSIVDLKKDPENIYDSNAVAVFYENNQIGYIKKTDLDFANELIDSNYKRGLIQEIKNVTLKNGNNATYIKIIVHFSYD
jgi:hypothetical protein